MYETYSEIQQAGKVKAVFPVFFIDITVQVPENGNSHPKGHGLHQSQNLPNLVICHAAG